MSVLEDEIPDLALLQARLTDHYRDFGLPYPDSDILQLLLQALNLEAQQWFWRLINRLDEPAWQQAFCADAQLTLSELIEWVAQAESFERLMSQLEQYFNRPQDDNAVE